MCYDKKTSITTYTIGTISSLILISKNNIAYKIGGIFFLFVSQMQMIEYLLWRDYTCNNYNRTISNIGSILNHLQPILLFFAIKYFNKNLSQLQHNILNIIISIYVSCLILYNRNVYPLDCTTLSNDNPPHLLWQWNGKKNYIKFYVIFLVSLILLSYFGFPKPYNIYFALICVSTYLYSHIKYSDTKVVGAMWCWIAALVPFGILVVDYISR
jgi:hypothetical protein